MKHHFECEPAVWHQKRWVFDWDDETGRVTGPDAAEVVAISKGGAVMSHPCPAMHDLSAEPLKSKVDMAAIIGEQHILPDELRDYYPKASYPRPDPARGFNPTY